MVTQVYRKACLIPNSRYLENTFRWRQFHGHFISELTFALNAQLPDGIIAQYEERCYVMPFNDYIYPDSLVTESPCTPLGRLGTATLERVETEPIVIKYAPMDVSEPYIEIITADDEEHVLTVIEFLSPTNKSDGIGRDEYKLKQSRLLASNTHLLELDFLRGGRHTVAVRRGSVAAKKRFDYLISLHLVADNTKPVPTPRPQFEVWAFTVRETLPIVRVLLLPGMPDALIDLQPILNGVYDRSAVAHRLKYHDPAPEPPLLPDDAAWANALLRERGLRL